MVLVGLGILFASLTFLAFHVPRSQWRKTIENWRRRKDGETDRLTAERKTNADNATIQGNVVKPAAEPSLLSHPDLDSSRNRATINGAPQATTLEQAPLKITTQSPDPTFLLDNTWTSVSPRAEVKKIAESARILTRPSGATARVERTSKWQIQNDSSMAAPVALPSLKSESKTQQPSSLLMPPPARPNALRPLPKLANSHQLNPSLASTLRAPPSQSRASPSKNASAATTSTLPATARPSRKVILPPGHSPLDWAHLTSHPPTPTFLRGASVPPQLIRVSPSQLREHNGRKGKDAWSTWQGKVYNVTPYRKFHPGGVGELMRGAGKPGEAERLFLEIHPWVNWESMLGECMIGILVGENEGSGNERNLEDMD